MSKKIYHLAPYVLASDTNIKEMFLCMKGKWPIKQTFRKRMWNLLSQPLVLQAGKKKKTKKTPNSLEK